MLKAVDTCKQVNGMGLRWVMLQIKLRSLWSLTFGKSRDLHHMLAGLVASARNQAHLVKDVCVDVGPRLYVDAKGAHIVC